MQSYEPSKTSPATAQRASAAAPTSAYTYARLNDPDRIEVRQGGNCVATFTIGCYTVMLMGPSRTFTEPGASGISITHATWLRTLPAPFQEPVNETWLNAARTANANNVPDLLQIGMQYIKDAPPIMDGSLQITDFSKLQIGDLLCWDASGDDGAIDHVGMYMGVDSSGKHRFISSRKSVDGPTLGDYNGASILDGNGLYARSLRMARRY